MNDMISIFMVAIFLACSQHLGGPLRTNLKYIIDGPETISRYFKLSFLDKVTLRRVSPGPTENHNVKNEVTYRQQTHGGWQLCIRKVKLPEENYRLMITRSVLSLDSEESGKRGRPVMLLVSEYNG
jgi:hypothetical protein